MEKPNFESQSKNIYPTKRRQKAFQEGCEHVWNTYVVPLESEIKALRDWKESALAVFAEWDRVSDYIKPRCRLGDKYSARALELFKMIDAENKSLQEKLKIAEHLKELADDAIVTLQKEVEKLKDDNELLLKGALDNIKKHMHH